MRKIIPAVVAGAATLIVAGTSVGHAVLDKDIQVSVDGATRDVSTMAGTVGQALQGQGIQVSEHDVVAPELGTPLVDGTRIAVRYGRQVTVTVDGRRRTYWTTATSVSQALAALKLDSAGAEVSTSRSAAIGRQGLSLTLTTRKNITVDVAGARRRLQTTAPTVGAALAAAKVTVDADDRLSARPSAPLSNGATVAVTRVDVTKVAKKTKVNYATRYRRTDALDQGDTDVKTAGKAGVRTIVYTEVRHNGKLQSRKQVSSKITTPARTKVVLRGTREPEPGPRADNDSGSGSGDGDSSASSRGGDRATAFVTGYTYWDNSPPGSAQIAHPILHQRAGGKGTYRDPITVAVGYTSAGPDFAYGTRFYLPRLDKYFIVEDICGACHRPRGGTAYTLDIWLDGSNMSNGRATACSYRVTGPQPAIRKPSSGLPVRSGSVC